MLFAKKTPDGTERVKAEPVKDRPARGKKDRFAADEPAVDVDSTPVIEADTEPSPDVSPASPEPQGQGADAPAKDAPFDMASVAAAGFKDPDAPAPVAAPAEGEAEPAAKQARRGLFGRKSAATPKPEKAEKTDKPAKTRGRKWATPAMSLDESETSATNTDADSQEGRSERPDSTAQVKAAVSRLKKAWGVGRKRVEKPDAGFAADMPADETSPDTVVPGGTDGTDGKAAKASKSLFARKGKAATGESSKPRKAGKKPAAPRTRRGKSSESVVIQVETDRRRTTRWAVARTGCTQLSANEDTSVLVFSGEDLRLKVTKRLSRHAAARVALTEVGDPIRVVNQARLRTVYARRIEQFEADTSLIPAQQALDALLAERGIEMPVVTGFLLRDTDGKPAILLLYHYDAEAQASKLQVSFVPDDLEVIINQFIASRKITREGLEVVLFGNEDLLSVAHRCLPYPAGGGFLGLSPSQLSTSTIALLAAASVAMGGYAWDQHRQLEQHKSNTSRLRAQVQAAERQAAQAVAQSLQSFASLYSVEPRRTFELATQAWRATGEVTLRATDAATSLVLTVPLVNSRTYASRPSVEATIPRQVLADLIDYTPPAGCNAQPLATSGTFRDVQITLDCPTAHPGPARYRLD